MDDPETLETLEHTRHRTKANEAKKKTHKKKTTTQKTKNMYYLTPPNIGGKPRCS